MSQSQNRVYLGADTLMLNINDDAFDDNARRVTGVKNWKKWK